MKAWHLTETHRLVHRLFGHPQEQLVRECTRSIIDRQNFARYHYREVLRLSKHFERTHLRNKSLFEIHVTKTVRCAFESYIIKAGAHATAAIQNVHSIPDILANALYFATGLNLENSPLPDHLINVKSVTKKLLRTPRLHRLATLLSRTGEGDDWEYLSAAVNMSKHRSVVRSSLSEDWTGKRKNLRELQFAIFERSQKRYWSKSLEAAIDPEYKRISELVIKAGHELNQYLSEKAAK